MFPIVIISLISCMGMIDQIQAAIVYQQSFSSPNSASYNFFSTNNWNRGGHTGNLSLSGGTLKVKYKEGSNHGGSLRYYFGGADSTTYSRSLPTSNTQYNELYLQYRFKFQDGFNIPNNVGGKMAGLAGRRNGGWGCKEPGWNGYEGWSSRIGYKKTNSDGIQLHAYTYHYDTPPSVGHCGDNIFIRYWTFAKCVFPADESRFSVAEIPPA